MTIPGGDVLGLLWAASGDRARSAPDSGAPSTRTWLLRPRSRASVGPTMLSVLFRQSLFVLCLLRKVTTVERLRVSHVLPSGSSHSRLRRVADRWARAGVVMWSADLDAPLERIAATAGVGLPRELRVGSGGGVMGLTHTLDTGHPRLLRLGRAGTSSDPRPVAAVLRELVGEPNVPRAHAWGALDGVAWLLETALPGRPLDRLTPSVLMEVAALLRRVPRSVDPPAAVCDDLLAIAAAVPELAGALGELHDRMATGILGESSVLRHGDLWPGNLLVLDGHLSGIVDWDAACSGGMAGADLLQLVATDRRRRDGLSLGAQWLRRPWRDERFGRLLADTGWGELGVTPVGERLERIGVAWWAAEVSGTLRRHPQRASDARWLEHNVVPVLDALE